MSPNGNDEENSGTRSSPFRSIGKGVAMADPGDRVVLLPGTYLGTNVLSRSGTPEDPITIVSHAADQDDYAVIDGGYPEGWDEYYLKPGMPEKSTRNHAFVIEDSEWLAFENLVIRNAYNVGFKLHNSRYITIRGCDIQGAGRAVETNDEGSHHILVEHNYWTSMPNDVLFEQLEWNHGKKGPYNYMAQGSLFMALRGGGGSVIRHNRTTNAFNALQLIPVGMQHGDNLEIYGNTLGRSLDNVYEPEKYVFNQHVYHNVMIGWKGSMAISIQEVAGGPLYFYGNIVHSGRLIWKMNFERREPYFSDVFHCYHNVFDSGEGVNHDRSFKNWHHFNNVYNMSLGMRNWPVDMLSQTNNLFDYDCSTHPWPALLVDDNQERNGLPETDPHFVNRAERDYRLRADSPCRNRGKVIEGFTQEYGGNAPDIGAFEDDRLVEGPPFYTMIPPGGLLYAEKPRISRHRVQGDTLVLFFTWPLRPDSLAADAVKLLADGQVVRILSAAIGASAREVIVRADRDLENAALKLRFDPLPVGDNGETATHWAATIDTNITLWPDGGEASDAGGGTDGSAGGDTGPSHPGADAAIGDTQNASADPLDPIAGGCGCNASHSRQVEFLLLLAVVLWRKSLRHGPKAHRTTRPSHVLQ